MKEKGNIFVDATSQVDVFDDGNEHSTWVYYLTHVLQVVYMLGFVASSILFVNAYVVHTRFFPGAANNDIYSERYVSLWWWVLFFGACRFLFFLCTQFMFTYRNTMCCGNRRYPGCTVFWVVLMVVLLAADVVGLVANSYWLSTCNGLDAYGNPCNSAAWCCLPDVRVRAGNHCPNQFTGSCPALATPPIEANTTFLGIFSINVVFVAMELYFVLLPLVYWFINFRTIPRSIKQAAAQPPASAAPTPSAPPSVDDVDPTLVNDDDPSAPPQEALGIKSRMTAVTAGAVLRRPPQTPMLAAARTQQINHVTPVSSSSMSEKNTKQP